MDPELINQLQEEKLKRKQRDEERKQVLEDNTKQMFENLSLYLNNEFKGIFLFKLTIILIKKATSEEYKLLTQMNVMTREKYLEMTKVASLLTNEMTDLQQKCIL